MADFPTFFPPDHFKFAMGELYQTTMTHVRYQAGAIRSINNVLAGTHLKITDERIDELETTSSIERETETERTQSQSSSSQTMMRESAQSIQSRSQSLQTGLEASAAYGPMSISAYGDFGTQQSSSRSQEQAVETASKVVSESKERTKTRILESNSTRALTVITNRREHGIDNTNGDHIVGITRFVDEIHRVDMLRHGRHLFANIVIANPAAHYRAFLAKGGSVGTSAPGGKEIIWNNAKLTANLIERGEWLQLSSHFGVSEALPPPPDTVSVSGHIDFESPKRPNVGHDAVFTSVKIPEGYRPARIHVAMAAVTHDGSKLRTRLYVGGHSKDMTLSSPAEYTIELSELVGTDTKQVFQLPVNGAGTLDVGLTASNAYEAGVTFVVECELETEHLNLWRFDLYQAIVDAQSNQSDAAASTISEYGTAKVDYTNNPNLARAFVQSQLKRTILQQVGGTQLDGFEVFDPATLSWPDYPEVDLAKLGKIAPIVQFLDGLFDFEKMTVRFVENYLGDTDNRETSYEGLKPGPMKAFLESTFARVILPIARFGDNELKFRWFQTTSEVFYGEDVPVFDDPLSLAILDELENAQGISLAEPELVHSEEITLPSPHAILQADATLPDLESDQQPKLASGTQPSGSGNSSL